MATDNSCSSLVDADGSHGSRVNSDAKLPVFFSDFLCNYLPKQEDAQSLVRVYEEKGHCYLVFNDVERVSVMYWEYKSTKRAGLNSGSKRQIDNFKKILKYFQDQDLLQKIFSGNGYGRPCLKYEVRSNELKQSVVESYKHVKHAEMMLQLDNNEVSNDILSSELSSDAADSQSHVLQGTMTSNQEYVDTFVENGSTLGTSLSGNRPKCQAVALAVSNDQDLQDSLYSLYRDQLQLDNNEVVLHDVLSSEQSSDATGSLSHVRQATATNIQESMGTFTENVSTSANLNDNLAEDLVGADTDVPKFQDLMDYVLDNKTISSLSQSENSRRQLDTPTGFDELGYEATSINIQAQSMQEIVPSVNRIERQSSNYIEPVGDLSLRPNDNQVVDQAPNNLQREETEQSSDDMEQTEGIDNSISLEMVPNFSPIEGGSSFAVRAEKELPQGEYSIQFGEYGRRRASGAGNDYLTGIGSIPPAGRRGTHVIDVNVLKRTGEIIGTLKFEYRDYGMVAIVRELNIHGSSSLDRDDHRRRHHKSLKKPSTGPYGYGSPKSSNQSSKSCPLDMPMLMCLCDEMAKTGDECFFNALKKLGVMANVLEERSEYYKDFAVTAKEYGHDELANTIAMTSRKCSYDLDMETLTVGKLLEAVQIERLLVKSGNGFSSDSDDDTNSSSSGYDGDLDSGDDERSANKCLEENNINSDTLIDSGNLCDDVGSTTGNISGEGDTVWQALESVTESDDQSDQVVFKKKSDIQATGMLANDEILLTTGAHLFEHVDYERRKNIAHVNPDDERSTNKRLEENGINSDTLMDKSNLCEDVDNDGSTNKNAEENSVDNDSEICDEKFCAKGNFEKNRGDSDAPFGVCKLLNVFDCNLEEHFKALSERLLRPRFLEDCVSGVFFMFWSPSVLLTRINHREEDRHWKEILCIAESPRFLFKFIHRNEKDRHRREIVFIAESPSLRPKVEMDLTLKVRLVMNKLDAKKRLEGEKEIHRTRKKVAEHFRVSEDYLSIPCNVVKLNRLRYGCERLGMELGVPDEIIDLVKSNFLAKESFYPILDLLDHWIELNGEKATTEKLLSALLKCGHFDLALKIVSTLKRWERYEDNAKRLKMIHVHVAKDENSPWNEDRVLVSKYKWEYQLDLRSHSLFNPVPDSDVLALHSNKSIVMREENVCDGLHVVKGTGTLKVPPSLIVHRNARTCLHTVFENGKTSSNAAFNFAEVIHSSQASADNVGISDFYFQRGCSVGNSNKLLSFVNDGSDHILTGSCRILCVKNSDGFKIDRKIACTNCAFKDRDEIWAELNGLKVIKSTSQNPVDPGKICFSSPSTSGDVVTCDFDCGEDHLFQSAIVANLCSGPFLEDGNPGVFVSFCDMERQVHACSKCKVDEYTLPVQHVMNNRFNGKGGDPCGKWSDEEPYNLMEKETPGQN